MDDFLKKFNIPKESFEKTELNWEDLLAIREDFISFKTELEAPAKYLVERFHSASKVHSVRYRIKNPDHLIAKIIRKKIDEPEREITIENYKTELTDLIGLRILHLFKEDWHLIHNFIIKDWNLHEEPTAYYREGDSPEYIENFKKFDCDVKKHPFGYRSVHYLLETKPSKTIYIAEIQVRTIFEEAWSEIDHKIRYPYDLENRLLSQFLVIFNRLAGSADEMGSYVQYLKKELSLREKKHLEILDKKTQIIEQLKERIQKLELEPKEASVFESEFDKILKLQNLDFALPKIETPDMSAFFPPNVELSDLSAFLHPKIEIPDFSAMIPPTVEIPDVSVFLPPKIEIPDLSAMIPPKIEIPNLSALIHPSVKIPNTSAFLPPKIEIPDLSAMIPPKIEIPNLSALIHPSVKIPNTSVFLPPKIEIPDELKKEKENKKKKKDSRKRKGDTNDKNKK